MLRDTSWLLNSQPHCIGYPELDLTKVDCPNTSSCTQIKTMLRVVRYWCKKQLIVQRHVPQVVLHVLALLVTSKIRNTGRRYLISPVQSAQYIRNLYLPASVTGMYLIIRHHIARTIYFSSHPTNNGVFQLTSFLISMICSSIFDHIVVYAGSH